MLTGQSVTGIIHFVNKCPIDWYSKKQGTVETATFGSESSAARTATEQIIDLRTTLRYLGVTIRSPATCSETIRLLSTVVPYRTQSSIRGTRCFRITEFERL